MSSGSPFILSS